MNAKQLNAQMQNAKHLSKMLKRGYDDIMQDDILRPHYTNFVRSLIISLLSLDKNPFIFSEPKLTRIAGLKGYINCITLSADGSIGIGINTDKGGIIIADTQIKGIKLGTYISILDAIAYTIENRLPMIEEEEENGQIGVACIRLLM